MILNLRRYNPPIKIEPIIGKKVTYYCEPYKKEHGIIKSTSNEDYVFVVYNCNEEWDNYQNYTAAKTSIKDLKDGWI